MIVMKPVSFKQLTVPVHFSHRKGVLFLEPWPDSSSGNYILPPWISLQPQFTEAFFSTFCPELLCSVAVC